MDRLLRDERLWEREWFGWIDEERLEVEECLWVEERQQDELEEGERLGKREGLVVKGRLWVEERLRGKL